MNNAFRAAIGATLACGMLLSSATLATAATDLNLKNAPRAQAQKGVHTEVSGVSGWAVVNADGTLARRVNAKASIHNGTGTYEVDFNSVVTKCAYTGNIGLSGTSGSSEPGFITVVGRAGVAKGLFIQTFDKTGTLKDLGFHIVTTC
jgi:hypothetical protein